jgi:O-glycosyl hydrolase
MKKSILALISSFSLVVSCNQPTKELLQPENSGKPSSSKTAATGGSITVDVNNPKQQVSNIGAGTYFYSGHITSLANYTDAANWMWKDLNVNSIKIVLRAGGVEDVNDNTDPNNTDFTKFNFGANANNVTQITTAKKAIEVNPNIKVWAIVLSPPKFLKTNNDVNKGGTLKTSVSKAYEEFGEHIYAHIKNLKDNGITVSNLSVMNEPDFASTTIPYESAEYTTTQAADVYKNTVGWLKTKLSGASLTVPAIGGPDCINVQNTNNYVTPLNNAGNVNFFTTHQYTNSSAANFQSASNAAGSKGLYMAEWHAGFGLGATPDEMTSALDLVNKFHDAFKGGAQGWNYFEYGSPGVNFSGLVLTPFNGTASRKKPYYVFQQYVKNILTKNYVNTTLSGITLFGNDNVSAFRNGNSIDVNVVNWNSNEGQNRVRINFGKTIKTITINRTSATDNNTQIWTQSNVNLTYYDVDFAPRSFTTVRITY